MENGCVNRPLETLVMRDDILQRLEPFAHGCFSCRVSEWPQLKPLLRDAYVEIKQWRIWQKRLCEIVTTEHESKEAFIARVREIVCA